MKLEMFFKNESEEFNMTNYLKLFNSEWAKKEVEDYKNFLNSTGVISELKSKSLDKVLEIYDEVKNSEDTDSTVVFFFLNKLLSGTPLTPITQDELNDDANWIDDRLRRYPYLVRKRGKLSTYYSDINRVVCKSIKDSRIYRDGCITNLIDTLFPIDFEKGYNAVNKYTVYVDTAEKDGKTIMTVPFAKYKDQFVNLDKYFIKDNLTDPGVIRELSKPEYLDMIRTLYANSDLTDKEKNYVSQDAEVTRELYNDISKKENK